MPNEIIIAIISFLVGAVVGIIMHYYIGEPKCRHQFEEIMNTHSHKSRKDVTVYMCKKCGKRKITKV